MFLLLSVVHNCRNEEINVSYVTKLFYNHFLICNPKFCINQEIKVNEGDFLIFFFSDSVSKSLNTYGFHASKKPQKYDFFFYC